MQTLILPGYSSINKSWVDEVTNNLKLDGIIRPFYWMHWSDESSRFDPKEKAELIVKHLKDDNVRIIAKSIGTLVACNLISLIPDQVTKIILCGVPVRDISKEDFDKIKEVCSLYKNKITIIQNINDPHGTFEDVKEFGKVIPKESSDHNYPYYEDFNHNL